MKLQKLTQKKFRTTGIVLENTVTDSITVVFPTVSISFNTRPSDVPM